MNPFYFKYIIHSIIVFVLYLSQFPVLGMWKAADRNILSSFQHNLKKTTYLYPKSSFLCNSYKIDSNYGKMVSKKRLNIHTNKERFRKSSKIHSLGAYSHNAVNTYTKRNIFTISKRSRSHSNTVLQSKNDSTPEYDNEFSSSGNLNFNLVLKKVEKIIIDNLNDKDVNNQLCALNSINLFARSANFVDRFLKGGLLSNLLTVLEKPYQKSIWKLVNTYIWPNKPLQSPELLSIQELVLKIMISLSNISDKLRNEMGDNESLKKTLLKIYCLYDQLQTQDTKDTKEGELSNTERDDVKSLIDELFLGLGYKISEKITLVPQKVKETDSKEESWTWDKILPFSTGGENGSMVSIEDYLIPVKGNKRINKRKKESELVWIPYFHTSLDQNETLMRNIRINLGKLDKTEGLDELSKLTLKQHKVSSKNPQILGLLAVNLITPHSSNGSDTINSRSNSDNSNNNASKYTSLSHGNLESSAEILCNINMESSQGLNLGVVTERLLEFMNRTTDFSILNDIFTELWALLAVKSEEVLDVICNKLDLDLVADIVKYSCFNFDTETLSNKNYYFPSTHGIMTGMNERVSNIFGRLSRLRELVKGHFEKSPKGSITNILYNFISSNTEDNSKISVDLDEINTRIDQHKNDRIEKFKENTIEDAKILQMTLFGFLVELIYIDGNRSFINLRDHDRLIESIKMVRNTLKEPIKQEDIEENEKEKYRPLIDKRLELKTIATNVVNQENMNTDYSPFNSYKRLTLNGIDFLDIRMNSWKKQKQCLKEDFGSIYNSNKLLNILGHHEKKKFKNRGVRVLSIDGGGSKGVVALEILNHLYKELGMPLHECFDIICGTSTGGLLASLIALEKMDIEDIQKLYDSLIKSIFVRDSYHITGTRLLMKQAIYDDNIFMDLLKTSLEDIELIDYSVDSKCPKFFCVSTQMDVTPLRPIIWRNYNYHRDAYSFCSKVDYSVDDVNKLMELNGGSCTIRLRDAIKATTAALGYFPLFERNGHLYGDGALYCNNPAVVSLIEAKLLYPETPVDLLLSVGNGISKLTYNKDTNNNNNKDKELEKNKDNDNNNKDKTKNTSNNDNDYMELEEKVKETQKQYKEENNNFKCDEQEEYINSLIKSYENCMDHGSYKNSLGNKKENKILSIDQLITHLTYAATTSEMTHSALEFTMPKEVYHRFSPIISSVKIDETNTEVLKTIKKQTKQYLNQSHIQNRFNYIKDMIHKSK